MDLRPSRERIIGHKIEVDIRPFEIHVDLFALRNRGIHIDAYPTLQGNR